MKFPLSAQDVCFCSSFNGCGGGSVSGPFRYLKRTGVVTGGQYNQTGPYTGFCKAFSLPHCHHHGPQRDDPWPAEGEPGCPSQSSPKCPSKCDAQAEVRGHVWVRVCGCGCVGVCWDRVGYGCIFISILA